MKLFFYDNWRPSLVNCNVQRLKYISAKIFSISANIFITYGEFFFLYSERLIYENNYLTINFCKRIRKNCKIN